MDERAALARPVGWWLGLTLTVRGAGIQQQAAVQVDAVRPRVVAALGEDGYRRLVTLLARVVDQLGSADGDAADTLRIATACWIGGV